MLGFWFLLKGKIMESNLKLNTVITNGRISIIIQELNNSNTYQILFWYIDVGCVYVSDYYTSKYSALSSISEELDIDKNTLRYLNGEKLVFPSLKIREEVIFNYQNTKGEFHKYFIVKIDDKYNFYIIKYCGKVDLVLSSKNNVFNYDNTQFIIGETKCGN